MGRQPHSSVIFFTSTTNNHTSSEKFAQGTWSISQGQLRIHRFQGDKKARSRQEGLDQVGGNPIRYLGGGVNDPRHIHLMLPTRRAALGAQSECVWTTTEYHACDVVSCDCTQENK